MRIHLFRRWSWVCLTLVAGCAHDSEPYVPPTKTAAEAEQATADDTSETASAGGELQAFDGLKFVVPESWKQVELSAMQMGIISARFEMPDAGSKVTLTLSRSGGGIDANLNRWKGQFTDKSNESTETKSVAGVDSTFLDQSGRFSGGFGKPAENDWRMLGVIVPLSDQGYFIKLTGPIDEVEKAEDDFRAFLKSAVVE